MKFGIVAGEASGDILGTNLMRALKGAYPDCEFVGVGGDGMIAEGLQSEFSIERLAVMGIVPILKRLPELLKRRKKLCQLLIDESVDCFIGIDAPEFNLGLEQSLKEHGITTVHYVSPSVWAWREKRILKIKKAVDLMLTLLPFELPIYRKHQIQAEFVGHPTATTIPLLEKDNDKQLKKDVRSQLGLHLESKVIAVLPGSRGSEVKLIGPEFAKAMKQLHRRHPRWQFIIPCANQARLEQWQQIAQQMKVKNSKAIVNQTHDAMRASDAIILASGTATLEAMLVNRPMVVGYKVSNFSYQIFKRLIKIKNFSLPNLLAKAPLVPELIQDDCNADAIVLTLEKVLEERQSIRKKFNELHQLLALPSGELAAQSIQYLLECRHAQKLNEQEQEQQSHE